MEWTELIPRIVEIVIWVALVFTSLGLKKGLQILINAIETVNSKEVKEEVELNATGIAAFLINLFKKIAERKP